MQVKEGIFYLFGCCPGGCVRRLLKDSQERERETESQSHKVSE